MVQYEALGAGSSAALQYTAAAAAGLGAFGLVLLLFARRARRSASAGLPQRTTEPQPV